jgi:hypothetical protein
MSSIPNAALPTFPTFESLRLLKPDRTAYYLAESMRNLMQIGAFAMLMQAILGSELVSGFVVAYLACHLYQTLKENILPQVIGVLAVELLAIFATASDGGEDVPIPIADIIQNVVFIGSGASYVQGRGVLAQYFGIPESSIFGADILNVTGFCLTDPLSALAQAWQRLGSNCHFQTDLEDMETLRAAVEGAAGGGQRTDDSKGMLYFFYDCCHHVLGFQKRAASLKAASKRKDVVVIAQRQVYTDDHAAMHQVQALLETGSFKLHFLRHGVSLGDGLYTLAVLLPLAHDDTDNGANLLPKTVEPLKKILKGALAEEKRPREAVIYECCPYSTPLTEEQKKSLPRSAFDALGNWTWSAWKYVGRCGRKDKTADAAAKTRFKEHMRQVRDFLTHHSRRLATKALHMNLMGLLDFDNLYHGWKKVTTTQRGRNYGGRDEFFEIAEVVVKRQGEDIIQYEVRVAAAEQRAIDKAKAEGKLLNTLDVAGVYDSFAATQIGSQAGMSQALKHLKESDEEMIWKLMRTWQREALVALGREIVLAQGSDLGMLARKTKSLKEEGGRSEDLGEERDDESMEG